MSAKSHIEWTNATWSPVVGCTRVSEGCRHCYAERMAARIANIARASVGIGGRGTERQAAYAAAVKWDGTKALPQWSNDVLTLPSVLDEPLHWKQPRRIFVCSMSDLFHKDVPFEFIARVFDIMCSWRWPNKAAERSGDQSLLEDPGHTYQVLTKRPERIMTFLEFMDTSWQGDSPFNIARSRDGKIPGHIWVGTSCENQPTANERVPHLLRCPATVRFLSLEPLLGAIDLHSHFAGFCPTHDFPGGFCVQRHHPGVHHISWIIAGGESGPGARPMHPDWVRSIRDQCAAAGVPFFFKQWGEWIYKAGAHMYDSKSVIPAGDGKDIGVYRRVGKKHAGRTLDGRTHDEYPEVDT